MASTAEARLLRRCPAISHIRLPVPWVWCCALLQSPQFPKAVDGRESGGVCGADSRPIHNSLVGPRILLLLPQLPQDPTSGAARSTLSAAQFARDSGFEVRALATTATESPKYIDPLGILRSLGCDPEVRPSSNQHFQEIRFERRGIPYTLLDTGRLDFMKWEPTHGRQMDLLLEHELSSFQPDVVFTYGGQPGDVRRLRMARQRGARIAFALHNLHYFVKPFFDEVDVVLVPSRFLASKYREKIGIDSVALPGPVDPEDVIAENREPIFVTMVNPGVEKGLFFFVRLAEELGKYHPKIAVLVIEARGTGGSVCAAGLKGGFDLRRHESIMISPAVPKPKDIYRYARVLLAPSVIEEPAPRVVPEALMNGVPPLVSDRGGLAEVANGAGFVLPLPAHYVPTSRVPVRAEEVQPWIDVIERLAFDEPFYQAEVQKARQAAELYRPENLRPMYADFFVQAALRSGRR